MPQETIMPISIDTAATSFAYIDSVPEVHKDLDMVIININLIFIYNK